MTLFTSKEKRNGEHKPNLNEETILCLLDKIAAHDVFLRAEADQTLASGLVITRAVDLAKRGSLFRVHHRLTNRGSQPKDVASFPVWQAAWRSPGLADWVRSWRALSFEGSEVPLTAQCAVRLRSHIHSSDAPGDGCTPYWLVGGPEGRMFFSLDWCRGWQVDLRGMESGLAFSVFLPADET